MKKLYLSGRIAGLPEEEYRANFAQAALDALAFFPGEQVTIINPAALPSIHNTWADYIIRDLMLLKDCDAIVMLPDWKNSKGARVEHAFAIGMGIDIKYLSLPIPSPPDLSCAEPKQERIGAIAERLFNEHRKRYDTDSAYHDRIENLLMDPFVSGSYEAGFIVAVNYLLHERKK